MHDWLSPGADYPLAEFVERSTTALRIASERVAATYGFACTSAAATTAQISSAATAYSPDALVEVVRMWPPMPPEDS
jgi:uncharacterized repeat protein (TIGR04042 family)